MRQLAGDEVASNIRKSKLTMLVEKIAGHDIIAAHGPLLVAGALMWFAGFMLFCTGLIGEVLMRTYFESQGRRIYAVREIRCRREQVLDGAR